MILFVFLGFGNLGFQSGSIVVYTVICCGQRGGGGNRAERTGALQSSVLVVIDASPSGSILVLGGIVTAISPTDTKAVIKFTIIAMVAPIRRRRNIRPFQSLNAHHRERASTAVPSPVGLTGSLMGSNRINGIDPSFVYR